MLIKVLIKLIKQIKNNVLLIKKICGQIFHFSRYWKGHQRIYLYYYSESLFNIS